MESGATLHLNGQTHKRSYHAQVNDLPFSKFPKTKS